MSKPDLVFLKQGRPVAVVEAKGRPVPASFRDAVHRQLHSYVTATNSRWSILVDPDRTTIFRSQELNKPLSVLSTGEVLGTAQIRSGVIGERVLLQAINRWIHELARHREVLESHPELREFVDDFSDGITSTEDWSPRV